MKEWIEKLKREALEKFGEQNHPEPWFPADEVLDLIREIERLEAKVKQLDIGLIARNLLKQENEKLRAVRDKAERVVGNARQSKEYNQLLIHKDWIVGLQDALAACGEVK